MKAPYGLSHISLRSASKSLEVSLGLFNTLPASLVSALFGDPSPASKTILTLICTYYLKGVVQAPNSEKTDTCQLTQILQLSLLFAISTVVKFIAEYRGRDYFLYVHSRRLRPENRLCHSSFRFKTGCCLSMPRFTEVCKTINL